MKSSYKLLKLKSFKSDSLFNNLKNTLRRDFSLSLDKKSFEVLIRSKRIRVKGKIVEDTAAQITEGTPYNVSLSKSELKSWSMPLEVSITISPEMIIHEESIFLVGNKPPMISSNATTDSTQDHFLAAMTRYISGPHKEKYLALLHRIDLETSGLLLFCKKKSYNKYFTELFEKKRIKKTYLALIEDSENSFNDTIVENMLDRDPHSKMRMKSFKKKGKRAKTSFRKIAHLNGRSLIEATPETGRMHQIRVHLSELGFPIVGDSIYGKKSTGRTLLHAYKLSFKHPESDDQVEYMAPLPEDFPLDIIHLVK